MRTRLTLKPGKNGTKRLQQKYGERLVAVRYRYDARRHLRLKTVELVEEQFPWDPPLPSESDPDRPVLIRIEPDEWDLLRAVENLGGQWQHVRKLWRLPLDVAWKLGLEARIVR